MTARTNLPQLPVGAVLPALGEALAGKGSAVLVAPPGAGKTTLVPLFLLDAPWLGQGRIVLLEPRRLAARAAARRMAALLGEEPGQTVGYAMRMENRVSARTRILVVTEGVLSRMILDDPELSGVSAVIFDEFHERSLDGDFGLALALDVQGALRPDLRLLVMSATLDGARVSKLLSGAPVIESEGRSFPVEIRNQERAPGEPVEDESGGGAEGGRGRPVLGRADERGSRHLTEFTMLEWYRSNADYRDLMQDCVGLLRQVADTCSEGACFKRNDLKIDPNQTWLHFSVQEAFLRFAKDDALVSAQNGLFEELLTDRIEPALEKFEVPVILQDYPAQLAALARLKTVAPDFAERFELYVGGLELANGFSELTDPFEQRARFEEANRIRQQMGKSELPLPEPFLAELSAMPPAAGIALGVDRLVMLTVGADCIDQVVAFTPESL